MAASGKIGAADAAGIKGAIGNINSVGAEPMSSQDGAAPMEPTNVNVFQSFHTVAPNATTPGGIADHP